MLRFTCYITLALTISMLVGCAMCCGPYDEHYNVFGGIYQRADPAQGRVGSALSDPLYAGSGPSADSNLTPDKPLRAPKPLKRDGDLDTDPDLGPDDRRDFNKELEELRKEMNLDGNPNELPSPRPQPDDAETARGSQNRMRGPQRQWR